jgi:hypothetical protein
MKRDCFTETVASGVGGSVDFAGTGGIEMTKASAWGAANTAPNGPTSRSRRSLRRGTRNVLTRTDDDTLL